MSKKKFSPEDVLKILRACNARKPIAERCPDCPAHYDGCSDFDNETLAADAIEELLAQVRWIPVTERLPNEELDAVIGKFDPVRRFGGVGYPCLVMIKGAMIPTIVNYTDIDGDRTWVDGEGNWYCVTHWMHLPDVPGEEE